MGMAIGKDVLLGPFVSRFLARNDGSNYLVLMILPPQIGYNVIFKTAGTNEQ